MTEFLKTLSSAKFNAYSGTNVCLFSRERKISTAQGLSYSIIKEPSSICVVGKESKAIEKVAGIIIFILHIENVMGKLSPFDIYIDAANDKGKLARLKFLNVQLLNNGSEIDIKDIVLEKSYNFVAEYYIPWHWTDSIVSKHNKGLEFTPSY